MNSQDSQNPKSESADPGDRSTAFTAVEGGGDTTSAEALLVTAYGVMWVILLGFVFMSWRRQGALAQRIDEIEKALSKR
jgi:CcmD family protein